MAVTPRLGYELIGTGELQAYVTANEGFSRNDALIQTTVINSALATPPGSPVEGDLYIVAGSPTGAWVGHATHLAEWYAAAWLFYVPAEGWLAYDRTADAFLVFNGTALVQLISGTAGNTTIALTSGVAATLLTVPLAAGVAKGGRLTFWIKVLDGTDLMSDMNTMDWGAVNKAGIYTHATSVGGGVQALSGAGDILTYTFAFTEGTNEVLLKITATVTGMTPTTFTITFQPLTFA